jgi:hypothetical protein
MPPSAKLKAVHTMTYYSAKISKQKRPKLIIAKTGRRERLITEVATLWISNLFVLEVE